ncbi:MULTISPECIES: PAS domain-containing protein [Streptomyces]|uniref:PAS domain-containing protein n=1 Tax=Streptomyces TaxID=1883 RepID=UPI000BB10845|nr:PAS domain-containing protein [Streptomyces sp. Ag82_O1-15]
MLEAAPVVVDAAAPEDFAVVIDIRGAVMAWSTGAGRLLGYEPEDVVGRSAAHLLAAKQPIALRRHQASRDPWTSDVALRKRNGDRVKVQLGGTRWIVTPAAMTYPAAPTDAGSARMWDLMLAQLPLPVAVYDRGRAPVPHRADRRRAGHQRHP